MGAWSRGFNGTAAERPEGDRFDPRTTGAGNRRNGTQTERQVGALVTRALARELGISKDIVHRIWRSEGLRPHRLDRYMATAKEEVQGRAPNPLACTLAHRNTSRGAVRSGAACTPGPRARRSCPA